MAPFWKDKKILVTGADGFIGSHLTERLVAEGASVRAFVYYNSFGRWGWLDDLPRDLLNKIEVVAGDIRDSGRVREAVEGTEIVFHLASLIAIPYSYHAPESYVQTNVGGTLNVLQACKAYSVKRIIHTSTSEVYGTAQYAPIDEKHPLQGQSPYSASKIGADMLAESFYRSFEMPVTIVRPFNTYGPRQSARAVIPTILSQLFNGQREIRLGSLRPTRDFNFVHDTVAGFIAIAQTPETTGMTLNIGSGSEIAIGDLARLLMKITGREAQIVCDEQRIRPEKSEVDRLLCDSTLARRLTGWRPCTNLEQGFEETAQWVSKNLDRFNTKIYNI